MEKPQPTIGVLDLQGAVQEHLKVLERLGVPAKRVRMAEELDEIDALIMPGGESTTMGKLMERRGIGDGILRRAAEGMPLFGTCAGLILLAQRIEASDQKRLGLMDIGVQRNAFGRQVDSFEAEIDMPALGAEPVPVVFIRAPVVTEVGDAVEVMGTWEGRPVAVRQGQFLGAAFHPELTDDTRIHRLFVEMANEAKHHQQPTSPSE